MIGYIKKHLPNLDLTFAYAIYLLVNLLFVYKYGLRQNFIRIEYILAIYFLLIALFTFIVNRFQHREKLLNLLFVFLAFTVFIMAIIVNIKVDGYSLNADRWSAMDSTISGWLNGEYPYTMPTHLGGRSSNLPFLLLIGLPFFLIGDVAFLQPFVFILFATFTYFTLKSAKSRLICLGLLSISASFMWEVYTKSDLMSNFIIILMLIVLFYIKFGNTKINNPILTGAFAGSLLLTRLVAAIPLTIILFKGFYKSTWRTKFLFTLSTFTVISLLSFLVLKNCPSREVLLNFNPILLQNRQLPLGISIITLLIPFYYSFKVDSLKRLLWVTFLLLLLPVSIGFTISLHKSGFMETLLSSRFDISYFNVFMPFTIYYISTRLDHKVSVGRN